MKIEYVNKSQVALIKHTGDDTDVARAAWVSNFGTDAREKDTERVAGLINFLYREKHMSPFEHGSFTFFIDTPIFVAREFMRHRTFSYNETSGRYKEMEPRFYVAGQDRPLVQEGKIGAYNFVPGNDEQFAMMQRCSERAIESSWEMYQHMLEYGVAREVARDVLPLSLMTQFYATANPRNVMQFLTLRNEAQALYEIRDVARQIEEQFALAMPLTYSAFNSQRDVYARLKNLLDEVDIDELERLVYNRQHINSTLHGKKRTGELKQLLTTNDVRKNEEL